MALGWILLATLIAFPVAAGAWAFGAVGFAGALGLYVGTGFSVILAGALSGLVGTALAPPPEAARPRLKVRVDVTLAKAP